MSSRKKVVVGIWVAVLAVALSAFWLLVLRTGETRLATADQSVYQFDNVPGPIQPIPLTVNVDARKKALGKRLFNEPRLSSDNTVACATCHMVRHGGADGRKFSPGFESVLGETNSPTVFNATFNFKQFWDGRADTLEEQIDGPLMNNKEMATDWPAVVGKLGADPTYVSEFERSYADGISEANIKDAIATFERALITPNARFDRYLRGEETAISQRELAGYNLFTDLGCVVCHQGVNVGGTLFQKMGKMQDYFNGREVRTADLGRYNVTGKERDRFVFKVPGLRNVDLTAPYFHDWTAETLVEAVQVMAQVQLGYELNPEEVDMLVGFLKTLTGDLPDLS